MKRTLTLIVLLIGLLAIPACKKGKFIHELRIDLTGNFQADWVKIHLDKDLLFEGAITTEAILGYAHILKVDVRKGKRQLLIDVNGEKTEYKFKHEEGKFIHIKRLPSGNLEIEEPNEYFYYD
ncbi:MAG: hypothetical protein N4A41_14005 [Crocinitomicaceae bacterium]|jgi:hypothetical protein|nr:hypothetical protein [Crocinitomicaceae bacterium]